MSARSRGLGNAVRWRAAPTPGKTVALAVALVLVGAIWITAIPVAFGLITPKSALALAVSDLAPLIVVAAIGTAIGIRRGRASAGTLRALQASEARARELIEESGDGILVSEPSGRYVEVNPALCRMLGYSRDQLLGMQAGDLTADDDPLGNEGMDERLPEATNESGILIERRYRKRDGTSLPVEVRFKVLPDGRQQRNMRDISLRKTAEQHLARMERRYRGLLEAAPDAMVVVNGAGEIVLLNLKAEKQFGYNRDELIGRPVTTIVPEGFAERLVADDLRSVADALAQQIETGLELVARRKDATEFPIEIMLSPLEDSEGVLVTAAIRDISVRKGLEEQLRQAHKMEAVGQLAGGVAHDFNNLLTSMRGYTELACRGLEEDEPRRKDLDEVIANADRAAALVRQLLAFSRRQVLQPLVLDPADVMEGLVPMLRRLLGEDVELSTRTEPGLGRVKVDPSQLEQVIVNLAVNARDAMPGGGRLDIELTNADLGPRYADTHLEVVPGPYVLLTVSDSGVGVDAETRAHMFEPFFTTKEPGKGTGLGLATVYGIVKQSAGAISVYSEAGCGTTFRIYLPRVAEEPTAAVVETIEPRPSSTGSETILIAEDEPAVRGFARRTLEELGYTVLEATGSVEALTIAAAHAGPIALLVTDVVMPGLPGPKLAEKLEAARPKLRTLYVSGFTAASVISHGVPEYGIAFLAKPFSADALGRAVRAVLDQLPR